MNYSLAEFVDELFLPQITLSDRFNLRQPILDRLADAVNSLKKLPHVVELHPDCAGVIIKVLWLQLAFL